MILIPYWVQFAKWDIVQTLIYVLYNHTTEDKPSESHSGRVILKALGLLSMGPGFESRSHHLNFRKLGTYRDMTEWLLKRRLFSKLSNSTRRYVDVTNSEKNGRQLQSTALDVILHSVRHDRHMSSDTFLFKASLH